MCGSCVIVFLFPHNACNIPLLQNLDIKQESYICLVTIDLTDSVPISVEYLRHCLFLQRQHQRKRNGYTAGTGRESIIYLFCLVQLRQSESKFVLTLT